MGDISLVGSILTHLVSHSVSWYKNYVFVMYL